jgi:hypothetical protein
MRTKVHHGVRVPLEETKVSVGDEVEGKLSVDGQRHPPPRKIGSTVTSIPVGLGNGGGCLVFSNPMGCSLIG